MRSVPPVLAALVLAATGLSAPTSAREASSSSETPASTVVARRDAPDPQVLAISVDALNPNALRKLGHRGAPHLWRLFDEGAGTLDARSMREMTVTLPNHTSMVTGRRIDASHGGHGVTWNDDLPGHPATVQAAAGHDVESLFSVAHAAGLSTALFATKTKFSLFQRSWPDSVDRVTIKEEQDAAVVEAVRRDLLRRDRGVTFVHLGAADAAGHAHRFMSPAYLRAVRSIDALVGTILDEADARPELDDLTIILTADHGGLPGSTDHGDATELANFRVPFTVWGPGIAPADLYDLNPDYKVPQQRRSSLRHRQPVRNGNVANVALDLLGLDPVPGSLFGFDDPLLLTAG